MIRAALLITALVAGAPALADIVLPAGAALRHEAREAGGTYELPIGRHNGDTMPTIGTEGAILTRAWRIGGTGMSSFQLLVSLREQLIGEGYDILFECDQDSCGGYDFRFDTRVVEEPEMHVDLGDYRFLSAHMPGDSGIYASVLTSRSSSAGFVQLIQVSPAGVLPAQTVTSSKAPATGETGQPAVLATPGDVGTAMETVGRYVLSDLRFETGSSALGDGRYDSLADLAGYLAAHPDRRVALVGHTDAKGPLPANIAISKRRATSVMERLITDYDVPAGQLEADGVGYLSPLASNQTDEGRTLNRRVEAILVTTD